jgi:glutathione S-transferase
MPGLTLFHDPTSEPSRAVHWFALEAGIELMIQLTWLTRGEHRSPGFLKINPAHQVPALTHGALCLPEASAIMIYLAELAACDDQWLGHTAQERAYTNRFLSWHHTNTRKTITLDYLLPVWLMPAYKGDAPPGVEEIGQLKEGICRSLALMDLFLAERGEYLGGEKPSVADLFIASDVFALDVDPGLDELIGPFPRVFRWLERLRTRQAYRVSHAPWNAVIPRIRELLCNADRTTRDPFWVADTCLAAIRPERKAT